MWLKSPHFLFLLTRLALFKSLYVCFCSFLIEYIISTSFISHFQMQFIMYFLSILILVCLGNFKTSFAFSTTPGSVVHRVTRSYSSFKNSTLPSFFTMSDTDKSLIKRLYMWEALGGIKFLKIRFNILLQYYLGVLCIYNVCLRFSYFRNQWKHTVKCRLNIHTSRYSEFTLIFPIGLILFLTKSERKM